MHYSVDDHGDDEGNGICYDNIYLDDDDYYCRMTSVMTTTNRVTIDMKMVVSSLQSSLFNP